MSKGSNIKRIIKKKIDISRNGEKKVLNLKRKDKPIEIVRKGENYKSRQQKDMDRFEQRIYKSVKKKEAAHPIKKNKKNKNIPPKLKFKEFPPYIKKEIVDYDVIITISSYNRFDKVKRLVDQLLEQNSKYSYKIILLNDGSNEQGKYNIFKEYDDIEYLVNQKNGGKNKYWETITKLWTEVKKYKTHCLLQIDDDFLICNNFIDRLMDKFFELKEKNSQYCGIRYHVTDYNDIIKLYSKYENDTQNCDG